MNMLYHTGETEPIEEYLLRQLGGDFSDFTKEKKQLFMKNYIYMTSIVIKDLKEIDDRVSYCKKEYSKLENNKTNEAEYQRRKLEYFAKINKTARIEITKFLHNKLNDYLLDHNFDILKREEDKDELTMLLLTGRYKFAEMYDYYDINFDFSTYAKVNYFPDIPLIQKRKMTKKYIDLKKDNPSEYQKEIKKLVDDKEIMIELSTRVVNNYYLNKRKDLFKTLVSLYEEKSYQAFIALGLLQLEGIFYDYCLVKFGDIENMGTLVEKVSKSFNDNDKMSMFYYPYFAFDVPVMRNEIAHKGMINTDNIEATMYNLILDLNSVIRMVEEESTDKFKIFIIIYAELKRLNPSDKDYVTNLNKELLLNLIGYKFLTQNYFWQLLKEPDKYEKEIGFYASDNLQDGNIDIAIIVKYIAELLKKEDFWQVVVDNINEDLARYYEIPKDLYELASKLKKDYISILSGNAKKKCIQLSSILDKYKSN